MCPRVALALVLQSSLTTRMDGIVNTVNSVSQRVSDNGTNITNLQDADIKITKDISTNSNNISTLRQNLTDLSNTVTQIQKSVGDNSLAIESAVAVNKSQTNKITSIEGDITDLEQTKLESDLGEEV